MRVLFYEPFHTGHHLAYLARMLPGFYDLPVELILATTPEAVKTPEFERTVGPLAERLRIETICTNPPQRPIRNAHHRLAELCEAIQELQPDHVALMYADHVWQIAALQSLVRTRPWTNDLCVEGWIYYGRFAEAARRGARDVIYRRLFRRLLKTGLFARLHIDHEILYEFASRHRGTSPTEVVLAPNPVVLFPMLEKCEARRRLGLPIEGRIVSLSGMISQWKGARLLLDAFADYVESGRAEESDRLLLAGPHDAAVRAILQTARYKDWLRQGRVLSLDKYLSEVEMFLVASASDLVTAPYPNHQGRSSIILWAAAAGRPSLGVDEGCIAHVIQKEKLGWTCAVSDPLTFAEAIASALAQDWSPSDAQHVRRYAEFHSVENYQRVSSDLLRRRLAAHHLPTGSARIVP
jgi:glycosyltransferase involved in cell wall biosynthesis